MQNTRQTISIILMVLLMASISPLFRSYLGSRPQEVLSTPVSTATSTTLKPGIVYPVAKVDVSVLAPANPIEASADSHLQILSESGATSTGSPLMGAIPSSSSVRIISEFEGLNQIMSCTCTPPDVQFATGPNHVVEMVNFEGEIFSKQGVTNKTFALSSLFGTGSDSISDPKVLFDASSRRWFTSLTDISLNRIFIGVSSSGDPTGTWVLYALSTGSNLPDQPIIGVSDDEFVASANDFFSRSFVGSQYWILNKSEMLAGSSVSFVTSGANGGFFSIHPVQSLSSTTAQYMVANIVNRKSLLTNSVEIFSITGVPGISTVTVNTTVLTVSTLGSPPAGVQLGTASTVNTGDFRVQSAVWFMGKLWYGLNDACTPSGDTQVRSCVRLTMVDTTTTPFTVKQDFDSGVQGQYFFYPALSMDAKGNLDLIYGYSSSTMFPSLAVTGQAMTDQSDSLAPPQTLKVGSAPDTSTRYGDYFGAGLDPSNPSTVWVAGEYHSNTTGSCGSLGSCWSTFIGSITMSIPITVAVNSLVSFSGINLNTTGHLTINTVNSTESGSLTVVARNSTTEAIVFNKTYSIPSTKLASPAPGILSSIFLLNVAVTPYSLSSIVSLVSKTGTATVSIGLTRQVDIDHDGLVSITDASTLALAFGSMITTANYDPRADFNADGMVDIVDASILALNFDALAYF